MNCFILDIREILDLLVSLLNLLLVLVWGYDQVLPKFKTADIADKSVFVYLVGILRGLLFVLLVLFG